MNPVFAAISLYGSGRIDLPVQLQGWNVTQTWKVSKWSPFNHQDLSRGKVYDPTQDNKTQLWAFYWNLWEKKEKPKKPQTNVPYVGLGLEQLPVGTKVLGVRSTQRRMPRNGGISCEDELEYLNPVMSQDLIFKFSVNMRQWYIPLLK